MKKEILEIGGVKVAVWTLNTVVVGTGAAGYNAAVRLKTLGQPDVAIVTEGVNMGTSRNTGSDKQTYYKLNLCGDFADSPVAMAKDLFAGRCVDGDLALVEAALSTQCFLNLCEIGVPFPVNRYGEFVGYKTDHDPRARATSVGPLTSKMMTEQLEKKANALEIPVFDGYPVISVVKQGEKAVGLLALNRKEAENEDTRFVLFNCKNIVYATGGPAGIYANSVYPCGHSGSSGVAFEAGVRGKNLTEWQYGLASTQPRWNVSGTYMQVLPRFVSVDPDGTEHEFLTEYFESEGECLSMVFRKGYEWPFDSRKALNGSSVIDLLVYREQVLHGRRVFLDYRSNPYGHAELDYEALQTEAKEYLQNAEACFGTPLERLLHMNRPAYELYLSKGVDLEKEMLEIALCAQHNNGGLSIDLWWQTNVPGLFAAGEVAGSHGVYRPGGSALNAGQVGSLRAAQYIARQGQGEALELDAFAEAAACVVKKHAEICRAAIGGEDTVSGLMKEYSERMSAVGGAIRDTEQMKTLLADAQKLLEEFAESAKTPTSDGLMKLYRLRDMLLTQTMYLTAMIDYTEKGGKSRGSALYSAAEGEKPARMEDIFRFVRDQNELDEQVQEICYAKDGCTAEWRPIRPMPEAGGFFENVWRSYRENGNVF